MNRLTIVILLVLFGGMNLLSACQAPSPPERTKANIAEQEATKKNAAERNNVAAQAKKQPSKSLQLSKSSVHPIFTEILPELIDQTSLTPRLPTYISESPNEPTIYAILVKAETTKYEIELAYTPDCPGINACRLGKISATDVKPDSFNQGKQKVILANGIEGEFTDATCNAYCTDSVLTWEQDQTYYSLGTKAGKVENLVKMVNSAISSAE